jgi:hypothetical protein
MMKVELGELARTGLETRVGADVPAAVNAALTYYVGKLGSGRRPVDFPNFLLTPQGALHGNPQDEVEVEVDERIEAVIHREASRQGTTPASLARHAVLVYLAALDMIGESHDDPQNAAQSHVHA